MVGVMCMLFIGEEYLIQQVKEVLERTAETMCGIGDNQDPAYCSLHRQRMKNREFLTERYQKLDLSHKYYKESGRNVSMLTTRSGQLMHHFISLAPTYESIAGTLLLLIAA